MNRKNMFLSSLFILLLIVLAVALLNDQSGTQDVETLEVNSSEKIKTTADGTRYTVHPDKLRQGCPGKDCIPSIDNPKYIDAVQADWMNPDDRVIGIEGDTESIAFPLKILSRHEIVNTEIDGEPIVVTYCPLCRSGVTYSRKVNGETLEFGVSGKLYNANLVMYDRSTESYWSQIQGKAIIGPNTPQKLELRFSSITNWSQWKKGHPGTKVLSRNTGIYPASTYEVSPYEGYKNSGRVGFGVGEVDDRLEPKGTIFGISLNGSSKAYPEDLIRKQDLIQDTVGGIPVVILENPSDGTIEAFVQRSNGQTLNLSLNGSELVSSRGQSWDLAKNEVDMERISTKGFYWFAWRKFRPDTKVYNGGE